MTPHAAVRAVLESPAYHSTACFYVVPGDPCDCDLADHILAIEAEAVVAERARLAEAVRGLPVRGLFGEGPGAVTVGRAAVLALLEPK